MADDVATKLETATLQASARARREGNARHTPTAVALNRPPLFFQDGAPAADAAAKSAKAAAKEEAKRKKAAEKEAKRVS